MTARKFDIMGVRELIDGDSFRLVLDLGFRIEYVVYCRVAGIDAPEMRFGPRELNGPKPPPGGVHVRNWVSRWFEIHRSCVWHSLSIDKYGRSLGDVLDVGLDGTALGLSMVRAGVARHYDGKTQRVEWTDAELDAVCRLPLP